MNDKREQAMNAAIKEAYLRQHGALRGGKQYSIDEQYQLIFQRGAEYGHAALAAARSEWKAIETDADYPPIGQRVMLASNRAGDRLIYESTVWSEETAQYAGKGWNDYVAWMPIPEFSKR